MFSIVVVSVCMRPFEARAASMRMRVDNTNVCSYSCTERWTICTKTMPDFRLTGARLNVLGNEPESATNDVKVFRESFRSRHLNLSTNARWSLPRASAERHCVKLGIRVSRWPGSPACLCVQRCGSKPLCAALAERRRASGLYTCRGRHRERNVI